MGGRGASSGAISPLQAFKENARQFNEAKIKAHREGYSSVKYTDITGKTQTVYDNGGHWENRKPSMSGRYGKDKGTLEVKFDKKKIRKSK